MFYCSAFTIGNSWFSCTRYTLSKIQLVFSHYFLKNFPHLLITDYRLALLGKPITFSRLSSLNFFSNWIFPSHLSFQDLFCLSTLPDALCCPFQFLHCTSQFNTLPCFISVSLLYLSIILLILLSIFSHSLLSFPKAILFQPLTSLNS